MRRKIEANIIHVLVFHIDSHISYHLRYSEIDTDVDESTLALQRETEGPLPRVGKER